jgi:hypothetical protein
MSVKITWAQALAWRMRRHELDPVGTLGVEAVVRRLCGVQAQVASSAEQAIRFRRRHSQAGEAAAALADGRLVKTWAMRGTLHLLAPEDGGIFLSLIADGRPWERSAWQKYFGISAATMARFRDAAREVLDGRVLTRDELISEITPHAGLQELSEQLRSGWGTVLKPLAWQGDLVFGPSQGQRVTFMQPQAASSQWGGVPPADEAAPRAIAAYFGTYGPATMDSFATWLAAGHFGRRKLHAWFGELGDRMAEVDVDGERQLTLAEDVDDLAASKPTKAVRLLPGFDQYLLGPGTLDGHVLARDRRAFVSRQSGWIAPIVVAGGVIAGTWELADDQVAVAWFREAGRVPAKPLAAEAERVGSILGRPISLSATEV